MVLENKQKERGLDVQPCRFLMPDLRTDMCTQPLSMLHPCRVTGEQAAQIFRERGKEGYKGFLSDLASETRVVSSTRSLKRWLHEAAFLYIKGNLLRSQGTPTVNGLQSQRHFAKEHLSSALRGTLPLPSSFPSQTDHSIQVL